MVTGADEEQMKRGLGGRSTTMTGTWLQDGYRWGVKKAEVSSVVADSFDPSQSSSDKAYIGTNPVFAVPLTPP